MKQYYYVDQARQPQGPCTVEALRALEQAGAITAATMIASEGDATWKPWAELKAAADGARAVPSSAGSVSPRESPSPVMGGSSVEVGEVAREAIDSLKRIGAHPGDGLAAVCQSLDNMKALGIGAALAAVNLFCLLGSVLIETNFSIQIALTFKHFALGLLPVAILTGLLALARTISRGAGQLGTDCLIAGIALLPLSLAVLLQAILGRTVQEIALAVNLCALCLTILLLYTGSQRVARLSERAAMLAVPAMLCVLCFLLKGLLGFQGAHLMPSLP